MGGPPDGSAQGLHGSEFTSHISGSEVPPLLLPLDRVLRRSISEDDVGQGVAGRRPDLRFGWRSPPRDKLHRLPCIDPLHTGASMVIVERLPGARVRIQEGVRSVHLLWAQGLPHTPSGPIPVPLGLERPEGDRNLHSRCRVGGLLHQGI